MKKQRRGLDRHNVLHDGWRSLVCLTTLLKNRGKRRLSVEPRWIKQQTKAPVPTNLCHNFGNAKHMTLKLVLLQYAMFLPHGQRWKRVAIDFYSGETRLCIKNGYSRC